MQFDAARIAALVWLALLVAACHKEAEPASVSAQRYEVRGVVRGLPPDRRTIEIEHENIPGFMPRMTMPFAVRDEKEIAEAKVGDAVSFRLNLTARDAWIDQLRKVDPAQVHLPPVAGATTPPADTSSRLREGDPMPPFTLINQDGERVTLESFRGRPFVLTFIFTRCPIPNFCPRMSNNFAELQRAIRDGNGKLAKARLLSVTLDPAFDTPQILKEYGASLQADPTIWTLATGAESEIDSITRAFSVYRQAEGGTISHGLATALIDEDGKVAKIWRGNSWSPEEVEREIAAHEENLVRK